MDYKETIQKAIDSADLAKFDAAVQQVMSAKIAELGLDEEKRLDITPLLKDITVPVVVTTKVEEPATSQSRLQTPVAVGITGFVAAAIAILLSMVIGVALSVVVAAVLFTAYALVRNQSRPAQPKATVQQTIDASPAQVMQKIDSFVEMLRIANHRTSGTDQAPETKESKNPTLFDAYPNVMRWLQNLYAAQYEFDEDGRKYLFKNIPRLLDQMYYKVVEYDGNNVAIFETDHDASIDGTELIYPAILDTRTNKVVLRGRVCNP